MEELLEKYKSIPPLGKLGILLLGMALALYYSYDSVVVPAKADQASAMEEQAKLEDELKSISSVGQSIVALESEVKRADDEINSLVELLPLEPAVDKLLGLFSSAAKLSSVTMTSFVPEQVQKKEDNMGAGTKPPPLVPASPPASGGESGEGAPPAPVGDASLRRQILKKQMPPMICRTKL
jgi:hypothetical protein